MSIPTYTRIKLPGMGSVLVPADLDPDEVMRDLIAETPDLARFADPDFPGRARRPEGRPPKAP